MNESVLIVTKIGMNTLMTKLKIDVDITNRLSKEDKQKIFEKNHKYLVDWLDRNFEIKQIGDLK